MTHRRFDHLSIALMLLMLFLPYYFIWYLPDAQSWFDLGARWGIYLIVLYVFGIAANARAETIGFADEQDSGAGAATTNRSSTSSPGGGVLDLRSGTALFSAGHSSGNDSVTDKWEVSYDGSTLSYEDHDCDHCTRTGLSFDGEDIFYERSTAEGTTRDKSRSSAGKAWAKQLLRDAGRWGGRGSFRRLCGKYFDRKHAKIMSRVFD